MKFSSLSVIVATSTLVCALDSNISDCKPPVLRTDGKYPKLICDKRGHVKRPLAFIRTFYASSYGECFNQGYLAYPTAAIRYNTETHQCDTLREPIRNFGFRRNSSAETVFSNWRCYEPPACGNTIHNPSFDFPEVVGAQVVPRPTRYKYPFQEVTLSPWSTFQNLDPSGKDTPAPGPSFGYARLGSAADLPQGHDPIPSGNGENFAIVVSSNGADQLLEQPTPTLALNTTYNFEMTYSVLELVPAAIATGAPYQITAASDFNVIQGNVAEADLDAPDGQWHKLKGSFTTVAEPVDNDNYEYGFNLYLVAYSDSSNAYAPGNGGSMTVAFDNLRLTKAKPSTTVSKPVNSKASGSRRLPSKFRQDRIRQYTG